MARSDGTAEAVPGYHKRHAEPIAWELPTFDTLHGYDKQALVGLTAREMDWFRFLRWEVDRGAFMPLDYAYGRDQRTEPLPVGQGQAELWRYRIPRKVEA